MTRVTTSIYFESMIRNIQGSFNELTRLQNQLQTQKAFERPSENPVDANQAILLESNLKQIEQSAENVENGYDLLSYSDQILDNILVPLNTALEKTAQGLNAENDPVSRQAIANELQAVLDSIISIGNTQLGDKNIFGGSQYLDPIFTNLGDDILYNGNNEEFKINVFGSERIQSNITATQAFGASSTILDSDRNLDARLSPLNLSYDVPLDRSRIKTETELQVLGNIDVADAYEDAGGDRAAIITQLSVMSTVTDFDDIQTYQDAVRDSAVTALTSGNTIANMTSVESTQIKAAIDAAATFYKDNSNSIVILEGQENRTSRLAVTLTSTNSTTTANTITAINDTVRAFTTEVENYTKIEAVNAFYEAISDKSDTAEVTIADTFATNVSAIVTTADTTSITYATDIQTQAIAAIGAASYDVLTSNQKIQVDAAVDAARNTYAITEFKAVQNRSGMVLTHEQGDQVSIDQSQTQEVITRHFQAGGTLNRTAFLMETGLSSSITADDDFNLSLADDSTLNIDVFNGDTVDIIAKRINQNVNKLNVDDEFRQIVAQVDNGELILTSSKFFGISGSTDISDRNSISQTGLFTSTNNVDDLRNGNGFKYGTQKISSDQLVTEQGVTQHLVRGDIVTILEGDSLEYLLNQLNDLEGFDAELNSEGTGIDLQNMRRYSSVLKTVGATDLLNSLPLTDTLTVTDSAGTVTTIDFTNTATISEMAEIINAASDDQIKLHAHVSDDGEALILNSNESIGISFATTTDLDVLLSEFTDLSEETLISSDLIRSLGLDRSYDDDGLVSGENILGRQTQLRELNDGDGVSDGSLQFTISSVNYTVDLSQAVTLGDVKTLIEDELGSLVTVGLNDSGNGLSILSNSNESIKISELEGGSVGRQLGFIPLSSTFVSGTDIQGSDLDARFVGKTLLSDLNNGAGIDNTGFTISNGDRVGTITFDTDGDGVDDIRTLNDLVNHINAMSSQDDLFVEAELVEETGQIKITSKLSNTTLSIKEKAVSWDRYVISDIPANPTDATTLSLTYDDTTIAVAIAVGDSAQTIVDNINTAALTANFAFKARINSDGDVDINSDVSISASDTNQYYDSTTYVPNPTAYGNTASDLGLLGSFSSTSLLSTLNDGTGIEHGTFTLNYGSYADETYYVELDSSTSDQITFYNENASVDSSASPFDMSLYTTDDDVVTAFNADTTLTNMGFSAETISTGGVKILSVDRFSAINDSNTEYDIILEEYNELDSSATSVTVNLEFAETLGDVKDAIELATNDEVLVEFGHANRLELRLASNDSNQGIEIEEISSSLDVANSLGLIHSSSILGRNLRDGTTNILNESTLLSELDLELNSAASTYSGENDLLLSLNGDLLTLDLTSARTLGDVISLINSNKYSDSGAEINLNAEIIQGQYISITDENGSPLKAVQSGFSEAAEKLGLVADPDIQEESTYHSKDLSPENQTLNVFSVLTNLRNEFRKGDISESAISNQLNLLERVRDQFLNSRGEAGSRIARLDLLKTRFEEEKVFVTGLYSQKVDIDIIEVTQKYLAQEQVYQSGLSAASRVLGTSLFSFL